MTQRADFDKPGDSVKITQRPDQMQEGEAYEDRCFDWRG